jgi:hypothetical protein
VFGGDIVDADVAGAARVDLRQAIGFPIDDDVTGTRRAHGGKHWYFELETASTVNLYQRAVELLLHEKDAILVTRHDVRRALFIAVERDALRAADSDVNVDRGADIDGAERRRGSDLPDPRAGAGAGNENEKESQ